MENKGNACQVKMRVKFKMKERGNHENVDNTKTPPPKIKFSYIHDDDHNKTKKNIICYIVY